MGFLVESEPLDWDEALRHLQFVREHGLEQFVHIFHQVKYVQEDLLRWGDELEHAVLLLVGSPDDENRTVKVSLRAPEVIEQLKSLESHGRAHGLSEADMCSWMPEYGRWMLESTPRKPYEGLVDLLKVEDRMRLRRSRLLSAMKPGEIVPSVVCMPLFGVGDFCSPSATPGGSSSNSIFVSDDAIFPHSRFKTLTKSIRMRKGSKVEIRRPRFDDEETPKPVHEGQDFIPASPEEADGMDHVYADAMGFGMGCCCMQVTFQASNVMESRHLYDHLAVLTPIMLALTAATPYLRGWLIDEDSRWNTVAMSVDDRTPAERGATGNYEGDCRLAGQGKKYFRKSRYDSIDCYLCNCKGGKQDSAQRYNDLNVTFEEDHVKRLTRSGVDEVLARHIAHLFARDPLVLFGDRIHLDDRQEIDHWENLQSTNWQTVRWKPPPPKSGTAPNTSEQHIGWRVEFRSMEIQITDFENAAFAAFVMLVSRVILALELTLYIPISRLEENMRSAQERDAYVKKKFYFRKNILPPHVKQVNKERKGTKSGQNDKEGCEQMTIAEILGGTDDFPGLIPLCETYLDFIGSDSVVRSGLKRYMDFILRRAKGELLTPAAWMRKFITTHPSYKRDSRIPPAVAYDLMVACKEIGEGLRSCPDLLGDIQMPKVSPATNPFADDRKATAPKLTEVLGHFCNQADQRRLAAMEEEIRRKEEELKHHSDELEKLKEAANLARLNAGPVMAREESGGSMSPEKSDFSPAAR